MAALSATVMVKRAPAPPFPMELPAKSMPEPPPPPCSKKVAAQPPGGGQYVVPFTRFVLVTPVGSTLAHRGEGEGEPVGDGDPAGVAEGLREGVCGVGDGVAVPGVGEGEITGVGVGEPMQLTSVTSPAAPLAPAAAVGPKPTAVVLCTRVGCV